MSFRFRRRIRIAPGIRLNVSKGGLSLSSGIRGASATLGKRGVYANAGLPGTGLSYRTRIDNKGGHTGGRQSYRTLNRSTAAAHQEQAHWNAAAQVEAFEAEVAVLTGILRQRDREAFDWDGRLHFDHTWSPTTYRPPVFDEAGEKARLNAVSKLTRWQVIGAVSLAVFLGGLVADSAWAVPGLMGTVASLVGLPVSYFRRRRLLAARRQDFQAEAERQQAAHQAEQEISQGYADLAPRLRQALDTGDPEPLAELLEEELANETVPVPLVFEVDFDGLEAVTITLTLPEPEEVPAKRVSLTKRGRLSRRAMSQKMRREIFGNLACGLALRVAYEAFRVLQPLSTVEVRGISEQVDPATGHLADVTSLAVTMTRDRLDALHLDELTPEAAVKGLDGQFACNRKCELGGVRESV